MTYLKKTKLYRLLCTVFNEENLEACVNCHYYSHKGMEWLVVPLADYTGHVQITNTGSYVSVELYGYEVGDTHVSMDRMTYSYNYVEDCLELIWHRYPNLKYI